MSKYLLFLISILLLGCKTDNFYGTERYFETDKNIYQIGDEFDLTVFIVPESNEKTIRLYANYKNLEIYFTLMNEQRGILNGSATKSVDEFLNDTITTKIDISREKPFVRTFRGKFSESEDEIIIEIPELNFKDGLPKSDFDENTRVRIHGLCNPINPEFGASYEEFFESKDIKLLTK